MWRNFDQRKSQTALTAQPVATARNARILWLKITPQTPVHIATSICFQHQTVERPRAHSSERSPISALSSPTRSSSQIAVTCDVLTPSLLAVLEGPAKAESSSVSCPVPSADQPDWRGRTALPCRLFPA